MSTTAPAAGLWRDMVDDAAVFPPGDSPVGQAWSAHLRLRTGPYAGCIGPLLLAPGHVAALVESRDPGDAGTVGAVDVVVVSRADTPTPDLLSAVDVLRDRREVRVVGIEVAATSGWRDLLTSSWPLAVEVARNPAQRDPVLTELGDAQKRFRGSVLRAKLRTQATAQTPAPTPAELAGFIAACHRLDLPFKLTGGLHHAVAGVGHQTSAEATSRPVLEHGALNVLLATDATLTGAATAEVADLLARTDGPGLAQQAARLDEVAATRVRRVFTSYGCCGVLDPLRELTDLGLLPVRDPATT